MFDDMLLVETASSRELRRAALIEEAIEEIRPNLKRDGGDCELVELDGAKVMVRLTGAWYFAS